MWRKKPPQRRANRPPERTCDVDTKPARGKRPRLPGCNRGGESTDLRHLPVWGVVAAMGSPTTRGAARKRSAGSFHTRRSGGSPSIPYRPAIGVETKDNIHVSASARRVASSGLN